MRGGMYRPQDEENLLRNGAREQLCPLGSGFSFEDRRTEAPEGAADAAPSRAASVRLIRKKPERRDTTVHPSVHSPSLEQGGSQAHLRSVGCGKHTLSDNTFTPTVLLLVNQTTRAILLHRGNSLYIQ